jgi:hypothetical protein
MVDSGALDAGIMGTVYVASSRCPLPSESGYADVIDILCPQPSLHALTLLVDWSSVESATDAGVYGFDALDSQLGVLKSDCNDAGHRLPSHPIKLNIIWAPATEGGHNASTPTYVFGAPWATAVGFLDHPQDMAVCASYTGGAGSPFGDAGCAEGCIYNVSSAVNPHHTVAGLPVSYEAPFRIAWQNFIAAAIAHYNAVAAAGLTPSDFGYFRFGMSQGGEASPWCNDLWPDASGDAGTHYSQAEYLSYVQQMSDFEGAQAPNWSGSASLVFDTQAIGSPQDESYANQEASFAIHATNGPWGFGTNGLQYADIANSPSDCESNWCENFATFGAQSVPRYLQTFCASQPDSPPGTTLCNPSPSAPTGTGPGSTGTLVPLMPFAASHGMAYSEIYLCDLYLAFAATDSEFRTTGCWDGADGGWWTQYHSAYRQMFDAIAAP